MGTVPGVIEYQNEKARAQKPDENNAEAVDEKLSQLQLKMRVHQLGTKFGKASLAPQPESNHGQKSKVVRRLAFRQIK